MELTSHIHDDSQEDLLGFHEGSPNNLQPVYKMTKTQHETETKKAPKTLVLTKDKFSGKSYIVINNKLVPITNLPISEANIKSTYVAETTNAMKKIETHVTNSKMYFESRKINVETGVPSIVKEEEGCAVINNGECKDNSSKKNSKSEQLETLNKLERNMDRKIKNSHIRCNLALSKNRKGLLDIIENLRKDNFTLKAGLHIAKRKINLLKSNYSIIEIDVCGYIKEIKTLKETISLLKQYHGDKPKTCDISIQTEQDLEERVVKSSSCINSQQDYIASDQLAVVENKVGEVQSIDDKSGIYFSPYEKLVDIILHDDVNMGFNLKVPNVTVLNEGECIMPLQFVSGKCMQPLQVVNGNTGFNQSSKMMLWMCYKMCDKQDDDGDYPIHIAVVHNDLAGVMRQCQALKLRKLSVDIENSFGQTPLQLAVVKKVSVRIVATLKSFNANFLETDGSGNNIFHLAATSQYIEELANNNLIDRTENINDFNYQGLTPLMLAVIHKNYADAEVLIRFGADLNLQDKTTGRTALFHAVETNSLDLVNLLMENGADTSRRNFAGHTVQDVIGEVEVSAMLKKLFNELEENSPETRTRKRGREKGTLKMISKKVKI